MSNKLIDYKTTTMKKDKIIYWSTTGLVGFMMLFSAYSYLTNPQMAGAFKHLGFPNYFRIELAIAKILGATVLLTPLIPTKIKEWAYVGFAITFISASIAHTSSGDTAAMIITPLVFLSILIVSNIYLHKINAAKNVLINLVRDTKESKALKTGRPEFSQS